VVAACALSASAQVQPAQPNPTPDEAAAAKAACTDLYTKWRDNYKGDAAKQKIAYEAGTQFVTQCPTDEYISYVQKWVPKYEAAAQGDQLKKQYADALARQEWKNVLVYGKQLAAKDTEDLTLQLNMAIAGTLGRDKALYPESAAAARRALQLVEAGKAASFTPEQWKALNFANKDELVAWLNSTLGFFNLESAPTEAAGFLVKALQSETRFKKDPLAYYWLSLAYQNAEYAPQAKEYQAACAGKDLNDECKLKLDKLNLVVDRIIDALARTVSLTPDAATKAKRMQDLEGFYKFRNNEKIEGINELITGIQAKPLLLPSMQTMPTPAPATPPATSTTPSGTAVANPGAATTPTTQPAPSATPPANPTPTPKPANGTAAKPKL
jgi:hypothetical protein